MNDKLNRENELYLKSIEEQEKYFEFKKFFDMAIIHVYFKLAFIFIIIFGIIAIHIKF